MSVEKIKITRDKQRFEVRIRKQCIDLADRVRRFSPFEYGSEEKAREAAEAWRKALFSKYFTGT